MNTDVESLFFAMVSFNQVFTGRTAAELYNALYFRKYALSQVLTGGNSGCIIPVIMLIIG